MSTETKILGGILGAAVVILIGIALVFGQGSSQTSPSSSSEVKGAQIDYLVGQKLGSESAKVKLVEFSDFQCPACGAAQPYVKEILFAYPNDVFFVYRHFPLEQHKNAEAAVNAAEAASEVGKFWEMHDKLFATQVEWSILSDPTQYFMNLAKEIGVDENKVREAIKSNKYADRIDRDLIAGRALGVNSTPAFFINGKKAQLKSFNDLKRQIESQL